MTASRMLRVAVHQVDERGAGQCERLAVLDGLGRCGPGRTVQQGHFAEHLGGRTTVEHCAFAGRRRSGRPR